MNIVNLTPHEVTVWGETAPTNRYPASGTVARVTMQDTPAGEIAGIPLVSKVPGEVTGLPEPKEGTLYIVSTMVQAALPSRTDLISPDDLVRDGEGRVIGCRRFSVNTGAMAEDSLVQAFRVMLASAIEGWNNCGGYLDGEDGFVSAWFEAKYGDNGKPTYRTPAQYAFSAQHQHRALKWPSPYAEAVLDALRSKSGGVS